MSGDKLVIIAGACIFAAAVCKMFDTSAREYSVAVKTAAAAAVTAAVLAGILPVIERIGAVYARTGADSVYLSILFKSIGICFLTELASGICKDSGEGTLAVQVETAGKIALLIEALPLFEKAAELALELIY